MNLHWIDVERDQAILHAEGIACSTNQDLVSSAAFAEVVGLYVQALRESNSPLVESIPLGLQTKAGLARLTALLRSVAERPIEDVARVVPGFHECLDFRNELYEFVEGCYDFWRSYDRFMVLHSEPGPSGYDQRPYRAFNNHAEMLTHLVRSLYRDICENITGDHPRVYRQVAAGCNVGIIAVASATRLPAPYDHMLDDVAFIRQVWIDPPLIIDPPTNRRTGQFIRVADNPLEHFTLDPSKFLCYPAQVGPLVVFVYFHQRFISLGCSLANLFELASDEQVARGPDAVYVYGAPPEAMARYGELPTVFYDDEETGLLTAAVPLEDRFGYFGYLKKMVLTLHNIAMMKRGRMPYHGAMTRIVMEQGGAANVLLIGDTATGKSESLEAFRILGKGHVRELRIIADDMGSLEIAPDGRLLGYGTEIGAFIRLDDLQQGYAFGQIDRAILMSPQKTNARVVLPVTRLAEVLRGYPVDFVLYANNYEEVDQDHPILQPLATSEEAMTIFREGAAMAKGTTTATGLVHSYFANIFGPPQYRELHDKLAAAAFRAAFEQGVFVGQMRTRLGMPGYERSGPEEAAKALFDLITARLAGKGESMTPAGAEPEPLPERA